MLNSSLLSVRVLPQTLPCFLLGLMVLVEYIPEARAAPLDPLPLPSSPLVGRGPTPIVMLNLPRDHRLFSKAYNNYTDITGDGIPDTTYVHDPSKFLYYGYFNPNKKPLQKS